MSAPTSTERISVLLVDNEPSFVQLAAEMLSRTDESFDVTTVTTAPDALAAVEDGGVECVVSDYDMPTMTGLELLEAVREQDENLPFVLFTGKGSEEIASEAIAAGVTGYLQKKSGREQYTLLANQIRNAVAQYRAETELRQSEQRYERTLTGLHETTRDLMRAGTKEEIYRALVETAGDILDVPIVATYRFEPTTAALEHVASSPGSSDTLDSDRRYEQGDGEIWAAFSSGELTYVPDASADREGTDELRRRSEVIVPLGSHGVLVTGSEVREGFDETMTELIQILAANTEAALDRAEREQLLREHDRRLTRKNEELTRLDHTNELVRDITQGVAQATTRNEIEETVCARLARGDRYIAAWLAPDRDPSDPSAWAGIDEAYADRIRADGESAPEVSLVNSALDEERVRVVSNVLDDPSWNPRRTIALTHGFQTVLAVPLTGRERRYGAVVIYATAVDAVAERERDVLRELGEVIGHAIRTAERMRAMVTDQRIELELVCRDELFLFNRLCEILDRQLHLEGILERTRGERSLFVRLADDEPTAIDSLVDELAAVASVSVISSGDESTLLDVTVSSTNVLETLAEFDARLTGAVANAGETTVTVVVPPHVETRSLVEAVQDQYPDTELTARREHTSELAGGRFPGRLTDVLTDKQLEALQSAHYSGFFDWPRESTGEDLAEALDISPPTFHYHLRAAQRKLIDRVLEGRPDSKG
ncbi:bacterio-opsin activator domain-containing protein [Halovivax cerinus]|uniref:Bacterio-opsin activator domain-containing protein n=1 Tax=Halovivax cerinus TaxID=1487865 RepID=A0ABD5NL04_9EURY|nr:bacterio-opsin activator domain-containing protein [Halovivax cerinus]